MSKKRFSKLVKRCPSCNWNQFKFKGDRSRRCAHCGYKEDSNGNKLPHANRMKILKFYEKLNDLKKNHCGYVLFKKIKKLRKKYKKWIKYL